MQSKKKKIIILPVNDDKCAINFLPAHILRC